MMMSLVFQKLMKQKTKVPMTQLLLPYQKLMLLVQHSLLQIV